MKIKKKFNIGFAILRIYLSFLVVTTHCFEPDATTRKKIVMRIIRNAVHVPNFYLMSFYFCYNLFKSKNIRKIKIRLKRLLIIFFFYKN